MDLAPLFVGEILLMAQAEALRRVTRLRRRRAVSQEKADTDFIPLSKATASTATHRLDGGLEHDNRLGASVPDEAKYATSSRSCRRLQ